MLRRNSSKRLDHRKSTSSVQSKHESIDPAVARHHAHTAATLAFARAQDRNSTDTGHSGGLSRSNTTKSSSQDPQSLPPPTDTINDLDRGIRRQHSVRFVGPNAVQRRQSISSRATPIIQQKVYNATLRPIAMTTSAPVPAQYRPPTRSSSIGRASGSKVAPASLLTANAFDEYYTREDDIASTPSSYRRLRRSKSMFSPLKAPSVFYTNGTPDRPESAWAGGKGSLAYSQTPDGPPTQPALRAPKSMSFLRGLRSQPSQERNDEAVQLARDRFFHETAQQRLREQPSFLFRSKAQRQEKPFRKSVRSSSGNNFGNPVASSNQNQAPKESSLKGAARKASESIKRKLKRVFGLDKDEPVAVPNQQVDARETHVRGYNCAPGTPHDSFIDIPRPDDATISRVAARPPSIHPANSNQQLNSQAGSIKSAKSVKSFTSLNEQNDDKSRVTSWNSTGVNTVASQPVKTQAERDLHRLSIINENGTHISSSSFTRPKLSNQFSAYPIVHRPSKSAGHVPGPVSGPVDSARVYSALMKRLDGNSPNARLQAAGNASSESFPANQQLPIRSYSANSSRGNQSPATIRHVIPEDSSDSSRSRGSEVHNHQWVREDSIHAAKAENVFGFTGSHVHQWVAADPLREARMRDADDVFSPKSASSNKENLPIANYVSQSGKTLSPSAPARQTSTKASYHTAPESFGLTPQELALHNEPVIQGVKGLRESRSIFFGGSTVTIARTTSPFRKAMEDGNYNPVAAPAGIPIPARVSLHKNPLYLGSDAHSASRYGNQGSEKAYSDSVYSRTTSGQNPAAAVSAVSLVLSDGDTREMPFPSPPTGDVVILDRATYRPTMPNSNGHRLTSSASSNEWKTWMSSEVAKLERGKENTNRTSYVNYALPTMPKLFHTRHLRESAQISDDDVEVAQREVSGLKQPLGTVQQQHTNIPVLKPILKNRSTVSLVEYVEPVPSLSKFPILPPPPPPPPPPIPSRSPLRQVQSKSSLRSVATNNTVKSGSAPNSSVKVSSINGRNLLHKRNISQTTLRSTRSISIQSSETPAKLVKRNGRPHTATTPSPGGGLTAEAERPFGSTSTSSRYRTPGFLGSRENLKIDTGKGKEVARGDDDPYGIEGTGLLGPRTSYSELDVQAMGSKQMVDLFLSSRRKRIAGGSEESAGVFL
jgi:hypothetical protein